METQRTYRYFSGDWKGMLKVAFGTLAAIICVAMISAVISSDEGSSRSSDSREVALDNGDPELLVADSREALDDLTKVATRRDTYGLAELISSGRVFAVRRYTRARILDYAFSTRQVRILSGPYAGRAVWVSAEWAKP